MNRFTKTAPWIAASLLAAVSAFGNSDDGCAPSPRKTCEPGKFWEQGHELVCTQMMAAYNAPARIEILCSWDFYATGSFTYWQPLQENMELGIVSELTEENYVNGNVVNLDFDYKPGFKVGIGMNFGHDGWDGCAQYTWFRGKHHKSIALDTSGAFIIQPMWGIIETAYYTGSEQWRLNMDLADLELARSCYVGKRLSFRPFFGVRGAWIRQDLQVHYTDVTALAGATVTDVKESSHSWAVGPRAGLYTNWMLGQGFRLYGNGNGDILYTRYTKLRYSEIELTAGVLALEGIVLQKNLSYLRAHLELELGLGWGTYFDNDNWHFDLAAGYGFQIFLDQNMFRQLVTLGAVTSTSPHGNLYVHGLTATARFDF